MSDIKVSIVVPVYNAEKTLVNCVATLINQTLKEIEIILVNDCSTDNSFLAMELLRDKFPDKIRIVDSKINQGAGGARNLGLQYAIGDYIGFVDSDDIVSVEMFEKLYKEAIRTGYDVIDCGFYDEAKDKAMIFTSDDLTGILSTDQRNRLIASGGYIVTKLFKADYVRSHEFVFRKNVILEDCEIVAYVFATCTSLGNVKEVLYNYKNYDTSSSKIMKTEKYCFNSFEAIKALYFRLSPLQNYESIRESVEYAMIQLYLFTIIRCLKSREDNETVNIDGILKEVTDFRNRYISAGYVNKYVKEKISTEEIGIMEKNDAYYVKG